jgi:hypothetical protein
MRLHDQGKIATYTFNELAFPLFLEEIAHTTYFCGLSCIKHLLFMSFAKKSTFTVSVAQNTYFSCHMLNTCPILALEGLTTNMTARAHQVDHVRKMDRPLQPVPILSSLSHPSLSPEWMKRRGERGWPVAMAAPWRLTGDGTAVGAISSPPLKTTGLDAPVLPE